MSAMLINYLLMIFSLGIANFSITSHADCSIRWLKSTDTNIGNGVSVPALNVSDCQLKCLANSSCDGVDWNPFESTGKLCWMSGPWSSGGSNGQAYGCTHYSLVRNSECPECANIWTLSTDTNVNGGSVIPSSSNTEECQLACIAHSDCIGIDWNPTNSIGRRCWLLWPWSGRRNNGTSIGVVHYDLARVPGCPLVGSTAISKSGGFVSVNAVDLSLSLSSSQENALVLVIVDCLAASLLSPNFTSHLTEVGGVCVSMYPPGWPGWYVRERHGRLFLESQAAEDAAQSYINRFEQDSSFIVLNDVTGFSSLMTSSDWNSVTARGDSLLVDVAESDTQQASYSFSFFVKPALISPGPIIASCPNIWSRIEKVGVSSGAIRSANVSDDTYCRQACIKYPNCTGVTYNSTGCYLAIWQSSGQHLEYSSDSIHWDLSRTSFLGSCPTGCIYSWSLTTKLTSTVTLTPTQSESDFDCRSDCIRAVNCDGVIFDRTTRSRSCQLVELLSDSSNSFGDNSTLTLLGLNRVFPDCGACGTSFGMLNGMSDSTAVLRPGLNTRQDCYTACVNDARCVGIEMRASDNTNVSVPVTGAAPVAAGICYHSLRSNESLSLNPSTGGIPVHIDIHRSYCGNGCLNEWMHYLNTNMSSVTSYPGASSEFECRWACSGSASCTGIDWDSNRGLCYHASVSSVFQKLGTAIGWSHYSLVRGAMCD